MSPLVSACQIFIRRGIDVDLDEMRYGIGHGGCLQECFESRQRPGPLASAFRGELVALIVLPANGEPGEPAKAETRKAKELAEDLGAVMRIEQGQDLPMVIAGVLREENASVLVMGYAPAGRYRAVIRRTLHDRVLDVVRNVDLYLVEIPDGPSRRRV